MNADENRKRNAPKSALVIYDGTCPMCTFQMRVLSRLDRQNRIRFLPIDDPEAAQEAPNLTRSQLREAIHVLTPDKQIHRGARAIRFLAARLWPLWPLCAILWIPGVIYVSEIVYAMVSRNRHRLSTLFGCKGACELLPEKKAKVE